ncbi:MAG: SPOR domain-containing protein [Acidobacteriota bacterium]
MSEESSHYEVSLTAGQAFTAFLLLLLSLAAAFAFGVIIGKGQSDDRLVVRKEAPVVNEGKSAARSSIIELGAGSGSQPAARGTSSAQSEDSAILDGPVSTQGAGAALVPEAAGGKAVPPAAKDPGTESGPVYAQLLSSSDAKTAESLAAKLIEGGFSNAFVERVAGEQGMVYRVRVKFASEAAAKAAVDDLKKFDGGEVWITK